MDSKTIITLGRIAAGTVIFVTSMVTGVNGTAHMLALVLLGVPWEALQAAKTTD